MAFWQIESAGARRAFRANSQRSLNMALVIVTTDTDPVVPTDENPGVRPHLRAGRRQLGVRHGSVTTCAPFALPIPLRRSAGPCAWASPSVPVSRYYDRRG